MVLDPHTFLSAVNALSDPSEVFRLGHVSAVTPDNSVTLKFDGENIPTSKAYVHLSSYAPSANDKVLIANVGHSAVVLGLIGPSASGAGAGGSAPGDGGSFALPTSWLINSNGGLTVGSAQLLGTDVGLATTGIVLDSGTLSFGAGLDGNAGQVLSFNRDGHGGALYNTLRPAFQFERPGSLDQLQMEVYNSDGTVKTLTALVLDSQGRIGFGLAPSHPFHVVGSSDWAGVFEQTNISGSGVLIKSATDIQPALRVRDSADAFTEHEFYGSGDAKLSQFGGRVTVGVAIQGNKFEIGNGSFGISATDTPLIQLWYTTDNTKYAYIQGDYNSADNRLDIGINGTFITRITSHGVGILTDPGANEALAVSLSSTRGVRFGPVANDGSISLFASASSSSQTALVARSFSGSSKDIFQAQTSDAVVHLGVSKSGQTYTTGRVKAVKIITSTSYTILGTDEVILSDATNGAVTLHTPVTPTTGYVVTIKKTDATVNTITITPQTGTIDGAASKVLSTQWSWVTIQYNGANYLIIG